MKATPAREQKTVPSAASVVRILVASAVGLYFFAAAIVADDPVAMLVGTFPIAWIAVEFAWVALRPTDEGKDR